MYFEKEGKKYQWMADAFSVELDEHVVVYVDLATEAMFTMKTEDFNSKFNRIQTACQACKTPCDEKES